MLWVLCLRLWRGEDTVLWYSSLPFSLYLCTLQETTDAVSAAMHLSADSELLSFVKHVEKKVTQSYFSNMKFCVSALVYFHKKGGNYNSYVTRKVMQFCVPIWQYQVVIPRYGEYAEARDLGVRRRYRVAGQVCKKWKQRVCSVGPV